MPSRKKKHRKSPRKDAVPQKADPPLDERTVSACEHQRLMQEWAELGTPPPVIRGLSDLGFSHPTPIQKMAIPPAISEGVDIIGAAETVSFVCSCGLGIGLAVGCGLSVGTRI